MSLFTLEVAGRGVAAFVADNAHHADDITASDWMTEDLLCLLSDDKPLWDGKSDRHSRPAEPDEEAKWQTGFAAASADGDGPEREDFLAWLVPLVDPTDA